MKILVFLIIGGVAAIIGWSIFNRDCDGVRVATESECVAAKGFDRAFCARAFARPEEAIYRAGNVFKTQSECSVRNLNCIEFPGVHGWTPKPLTYCVVRADNGTLASMTPLYDRAR